MKKYLFLVLPILLLAGCEGRDYVITGTDITPGKWITAFDSSGHQLANVQQQDTAYKVEPSSTEKIGMSRAHHDLWAFFGGLAALAGVIYWCIKRTNTGDDKPAYILTVCIAIVSLGAIAFGSVDWEHTREEMIPKPLYDSLMKKDGNLSEFWKTINP